MCRYAQFSLSSRQLNYRGFPLIFLKSDTLLIIDNFNVTATQDSFLSVALKYRCQILFTTRSKLDEYCTLPLKEISDMNALFQLASVFYSEADTYRATVEKII